jgi:hypothetical protein
VPPVSVGRVLRDLSPAIVLPQVTNRAFWACSGATTKDMSNVPGTSKTPKQYGQPDQLTTVGSTTKYITVTVGGDDLGFSTVALACVTAELLNDVSLFYQIRVRMIRRASRPG